MALHFGCMECQLLECLVLRECALIANIQHNNKNCPYCLIKENLLSGTSTVLIIDICVCVCECVVEFDTIKDDGSMIGGNSFHDYIYKNYLISN